MRTPPAVFTPNSRSQLERETEARGLDDEAVIEHAHMARDKNYTARELMSVAHTGRAWKVG